LIVQLDPLGNRVAGRIVHDLVEDDRAIEREPRFERFEKPREFFSHRWTPIFISRVVRIRVNANATTGFRRRDRFDDSADSLVGAAVERQSAALTGG
jgi:hypothetical protein